MTLRDNLRILGGNSPIPFLRKSQHLIGYTDNVRLLQNAKIFTECSRDISLSNTTDVNQVAEMVDQELLSIIREYLRSHTSFDDFEGALLCVDASRLENPEIATAFFNRVKEINEWRGGDDFGGILGNKVYTVFLGDPNHIQEEQLKQTVTLSYY